MKDDRLYLIHICESIAHIEEYTAEGREAFFADTRTQDAVLRNLQTLAESTSWHLLCAVAANEKIAESDARKL